MKTRFSHLKFFEINSVNNPNSIHGIYPYRGKMSPFDADNIIDQIEGDIILLDPFCGSGTVVYEAQKMGKKAIGIDNNPLAVALSKAKTSLKDEKDIKKEIECTKEIINKAKKDLELKKFNEMPESPRCSFHEDTADEIMTIKNYFNEMSDYLKGAYFGAIALAARGCNDYKWTSSTVGKNIEPKRYINFYEKFLQKVKKHIKFLNDRSHEESKILEGDSRKLDGLIPDKLIDVVFCSPPYFDALDYTAYYGKLIYEIHKMDRLKIKKDLIQTASSYEEDMRQTLKEINRITKDDSLIIFIVGDRKRGKTITNGGDFFSKIWEPSYILERSYKGSSSQVFDKLNKTQRKEQIVVWEKVNGEVVKYGKEFQTNQ